MKLVYGKIEWKHILKAKRHGWLCSMASPFPFYVDKPHKNYRYIDSVNKIIIHKRWSSSLRRSGNIAIGWWEDTHKNRMLGINAIKRAYYDNITC